MGRGPTGEGRGAERWKGTGMSSDPRIAYGARCTWWGSIEQVKVRDDLPVCPHCGHVLYEVENEKAWWRNVDIHDKSEPGYRLLIEWSRGRCFPSLLELRSAYESVKKKVRRAIRMGADLPDLELTKVTCIKKSRKQFIHLDQLHDGTWRLVYTETTIPDITRIDAFEIVREGRVDDDAL